MVTLRDVQKLIAPLWRRVRLIADRAIVTAVTDSFNRQGLQLKVLADEAADDVERFQNYGRTSVPPAGSEAIVLGIGGARAGLVAIAVEDKSVRPKDLEAGDNCLYHLEGHRIILRKDGLLELEAKTVIINASEKLTMISPDTEIQGPLHVTGEITSDTDVKTGTTSLKGHVHNQSGGGQTSAPV
ncbi:phage baseplate assembly protein V [Aeromonas media]|uniref:phage baseplate assembly protein V n=1 Tax=Aeromonas media TaxID=651 RepID=UPI00223F840B|nr:phage baseplate assembly protein V [Aeromonas media]